MSGAGSHEQAAVRVAFAGKGGAGKTTVTATLARLLARRGLPVVTVDADSNPNLAVALGVERGVAAEIAALPTGLVSRRPDGPRLTQALEAVLADHATAGPDGVHLVVMGMPDHADTGCLCAAHAAVSALLADLGDRTGTFTLMDLEASPEHLSRGTARHADLLVLVAEPYYRSLESARRMAGLAAELPIPHVKVVANKVRSPEDAEGIRAFCANHHLAVTAEVPWSTDVLDADAAGTPLLDAAPDGEVVAAIDDLAGQLVGLTTLAKTGST